MTGQPPATLPVPVTLSAIEHYAYCPRQAGLILLEDGYDDDAATTRGTLLHQRVHEEGTETRTGVRTLRALPVWHDGHGLTGICDVVELYDDGRIIPVEHKSGPHVPGGPADLQVAAQAICLEQMLGSPVPEGAIFSSADRRRHAVAVTPELRRRVLAAAEEVRSVIVSLKLPRPAADRRCRRCSMLDSCMPGLLANRSAYARAEAAMFRPAPEAAPDD